MATTMYSIEMEAAAALGVARPPSALKPLKVLATISAKAAVTSRVNSHENKRNIFLPVLPMYCSISMPIDLPSFLTEAYSAVKSCTAPKKMPPIISHSITGAQPNIAAIIGPVTGPAPVMDEN